MRFEVPEGTPFTLDGENDLLLTHVYPITAVYVSGTGLPAIHNLHIFNLYGGIHAKIAASWYALKFIWTTPMQPRLCSVKIIGKQEGEDGVRGEDAHSGEDPAVRAKGPRPRRNSVH